MARSRSPGALHRFLARFEQVYGKTGKTESIIAVAAAHHRLLWMHPFLDGNGRVARLVSHAQLLDALDTGTVCSVARGLARNVQEYKMLLANCDQPRHNDLDGRGTLSEEALAQFTQFFLEHGAVRLDYRGSHRKRNAAAVSTDGAIDFLNRPVSNPSFCSS